MQSSVTLKSSLFDFLVCGGVREKKIPNDLKGIATPLQL
jgi:hypothetical protein